MSPHVCGGAVDSRVEWKPPLQSLQPKQKYLLLAANIHHLNTEPQAASNILNGTSEITVGKIDGKNDEDILQVHFFSSVMTTESM